ncbi:MAG TPA: SCP2 sterol-binding domain-containing protein [Gaiellaceae bacterium]
MPAGTTEFFESLRERGPQPALARTEGTMAFELRDGKRTQRWRVEIEKGNLTVSHRQGSTDCTVRTTQDVFDGIVRGEVNAFAAVLRGTLFIDGDPKLLVNFQRLFPSPPRT